jgi:hypothetical protein
MLRRWVFLISALGLVVFFACSRPSKEEAQTQPPPPAVQPPATQAPPAQVQPAEPAPKPEAESARTAPAGTPPAKPATSRPAGKSTPASPTPAPVPAGNAKAATDEPAAAAKQAAEPVNPPAVSPVPVQPPPPPPLPKPLLIPSGTRFEIRLLDPISSAKNKDGDTFRASLEQDLEADGKVAVPRGSTVTGRLTGIKDSGRVEGRAKMSINMTEVMVGKTAYTIETEPLAFEAEKTAKEDVAKVGIGAGVGAIIGAIAGGGKGAAIGAAVGGGVGTATVLVTKGKDVQFPVEQKFSFVLRRELSIKQ